MKLLGEITTREWQKEALDIWRQDFRGVAHVVTGGGKTVFAYLCIEDFFKAYPSGRVLIVVPTIALLDQWYVDILDSMDFRENDVSTFSGGYDLNLFGKVNILVINTARKVAELLCDGVESFLIVDECHRSGSPVNSQSLQGNHSATLGLSATPHREMDDGFEKYIKPILGPIFYEYDYARAHKDKVIVDFSLVNIEISISDEDVDRVCSENAQIKSYYSNFNTRNNKKEKKILKKRTDKITWVTRVSWAVKLALNHPTERVVIFHERVNALKRIISLLESYGISAVAYHSKLSPSHRRDNLRLFRRGMVNMLATCRALDEGTNVPESNIAIVALSTSSTRQRIQRLGRVLRPSEGKEFATIYTLYSTQEQRALLDEEEKDLEGVANLSWKRGTIR